MNDPDPSMADPGAARRAAMSALADGDAQAAPQACALWRDDADARTAWHTYHLIGDVMRSDELASTPGRDTAFIAALRTRLADEPVVLAPAPAVAAARAARHHRWLAPAAVAAGFVAVAGVLVVARMSASPADAPLLATVPAAGGGLTRASVGALPAQPLVIEGRLIRDPRLDSYLRAHREAMAGAPAALPGGVPRSFEARSPVVPVAVPASASR